MSWGNVQMVAGAALWSGGFASFIQVFRVFNRDLWGGDEASAWLALAIVLMCLGAILGGTAL